MKRFFRSILAVTLISATLATSVSATTVDDLKDDKKAAEQEMEQLENDLNYVVTKITNLEADLVETGEAIIEATADLEEAEANEAEQYEAVKRCIVAMYENGNNTLLESVFESGSIADMLKKVDAVQAIHTYEKEQLESYVKIKQQIADLKASLEEDMATLEAKQVEYTAEKANLETMVAEKRDEIADFDTKIQEAIEEAEAQRRAEEAARKAAEEAAAEAARKAAEEAARREEAQSNTSSNSASDSSSSDETYTAPSGTGGGQAIVNEAFKYAGVPYVWGGMSSSGVDCSGLVLLAHRAIGVNLAHYSGSQGSGGKRVNSMAEALPGDVVCYVGHVGIYIGGGQMIHAPQTGDVVRVVNVYGSPWFRRYW